MWITISFNTKRPRRKSTFALSIAALISLLTTSSRLDLVTLVVDAPSPDYFTYTGDWNFKYAGVEYHNRTSA